MVCGNLPAPQRIIQPLTGEWVSESRSIAHQHPPAGGNWFSQLPGRYRVCKDTFILYLQTFLFEKHTKVGLKRTGQFTRNHGTHGQGSLLGKNPSIPAGYSTPINYKNILSNVGVACSFPQFANQPHLNQGNPSGVYGPSNYAPGPIRSYNCMGIKGVSPGKYLGTVSGRGRVGGTIASPGLARGSIF